MIQPTGDQYQGCLLGLALGDAYGAPWEGGWLERLLWRLIGTTPEGLPRWTDDTQMSLDLADILLEHPTLDQDALAQRFAASYQWRRGYGPATARLLKRLRAGASWRTAATAIHPEGSYGNGAAMRAPVLALAYFGEEAALLQATREASEITHAHPLGIEGAQLVAVATGLMLGGATPETVLERLTELRRAPEFATRLEWASRWVFRREAPEPKEVAQVLGNGIAATNSVVTAIYLALRHHTASFSELLAFTRGCGGDVDTLGAMAGALWGAAHGAQALPGLPVEARERIGHTAQALWERASARA